MQYLRLHSKRYRYFQIATNTSSIGCYFLACFLTPHLVFPACFSPPRVLPHRFRSVVYRRAHPKYVLHTYAPSSPTLWVFPLANFSSRPVFPRSLATSFQFVFSSLLFFLKTHDMCFFAYFSSRTHTFLSTISFLPTTYR